VEHEKQLHLIVVRRDLTGFQHVHPTLEADGSWHTNVDLAPGQWRLFADFKPTGAEALTLGTDIAVPGKPLLTTAAADSRTATVDGYTVTLAGDLEAGAESMLRLVVTKDGRQVTTDRYLGASGHLVALREGPRLPARSPGEPR